MEFSISDNMISEFISGLFSVFALIGVGAVLMLILSGMTARFPFARLALVLALTPFSLINFLERGFVSTLYLYAMIVLLLGITIDGINHILTPKAARKEKRAEKPAADEPEPEEENEPNPGMIVWEKAE